MIPTQKQIHELWDRYSLPDVKRNHSQWVARLALWFAGAIADTGVGHIRLPLLQASALLHDIDKAIPPNPGERHPDTAVRVLREEGMDEVADVVRTHPLHAILDPSIAPRTWEEKLLYLSDKMVKHAIITVDERFALWRAEHLPKEAVAILDAAYPTVKALEHDICSRAGVEPADVAKLATAEGSGTMESV